MVMENSEHTIKMPRQILQRDDFLGDVLALKVCVRTSTVTATSECLQLGVDSLGPGAVRGLDHALQA